MVYNLLELIKDITNSQKHSNVVEFEFPIKINKEEPVTIARNQIKGENNIKVHYLIYLCLVFRCYYKHIPQYYGVVAIANRLIITRKYLNEILLDVIQTKGKHTFEDLQLSLVDVSNHDISKLIIGKWGRGKRICQMYQSSNDSLIFSHDDDYVIAVLHWVLSETVSVKLLNKIISGKVIKVIRLK